MKYGIALAAALMLMSQSVVYAQEANNLAPPPPPELEEEEETAPGPAEKKKLDHCGPQSTKTCTEMENLSDLGDETWKVGAMSAALCSKSAAIEATRKSRRDRIEYEELLAEIAEDNETEYKPWNPSESNTEFAQRTANECETNKDYWCAEMQLAAAEIQDSEIQAETLAAVEAACAAPGQTAAAQ